MIQKLSKNQTTNIKGGQKSYCDTVSMLILHNWERWTDEERKSASGAYHAHC